MAPWRSTSSATSAAGAGCCSPAPKRKPDSLATFRSYDLPKYEAFQSVAPWRGDGPGSPGSKPKVAQNNGIPLTPRQLELLGHVASGATIEEAAESCFMARQSAYNMLSSARARAGCNTVTQLAIFAILKGWLEKNDEDKFVPAVHNDEGPAAARPSIA